MSEIYKIQAVAPAIFLIIASCSDPNNGLVSRYEEIERESASRSLEAFEKSLVEDIYHLSNAKADFYQWKKTASSSSRISGINEAMSILENVEYSETDFPTISKYLAKGSVWHFGFDGNYHALVAFDHNNSFAYLIRW